MGITWRENGGELRSTYRSRYRSRTGFCLGHEMAHSIELHGTGRETFGTLVGLAAQVIEIGISEPGTSLDLTN